jgi:hypothetical protein
MACAENKQVIDQLTKLSEVPRIVAFSKALQKLDALYLGRAANALRRDFIWLCYRRHENTEMHNLVMYNLISVYDGVARYLDCQGINSLVPLELFTDFSFRDASPYMAVENELFMEAGLCPAEVAGILIVMLGLAGFGRSWRRDRRMAVATATAALVLGFVVETTPHLVHHALDPDTGAGCEALQTAERSQATIGAIDTAPASASVRLIDPPSIAPAPTLAAPTPCGRAPPA